MGRTACTEPQCLYQGAPSFTFISHFGVLLTLAELVLNIELAVCIKTVIVEL